MNYGELKTHFNALLNRSDITPALTTTFINQGIARIQRQLRSPINERTADYIITGATPSIILPNDFLEIISIYMGQYELQRTSMSRYRSLSQTAAVGIPQLFTREQQRLLLHPQPTSGTLTLYYYCDFPALVNDADENDLTAVASDLVIYSSLTYAADYYLDERSSVFENKAGQFLSEIQEQANDQELNGGTQALLPAYRFDGDY
jgi:hypothetical protein